jgi:hypothetical protein
MIQKYFLVRSPRQCVRLFKKSDPNHQSWTSHFICKFVTFQVHQRFMLLLKLIILKVHLIVHNACFHLSLVNLNFLIAPHLAIQHQDCGVLQKSTLPTRLTFLEIGSIVTTKHVKKPLVQHH